MRRRTTGPSEEVRIAVVMRAGYTCEVCGGPLIPMSLHHRHPRQMGGNTAWWMNMPENLLAVCGTGTTGCHGWIESHRSDAYAQGLLIRNGGIPSEIPYADSNGRWWLLSGVEKFRIQMPT